jgi:hypothetical protein
LKITKTIKLFVYFTVQRKVWYLEARPPRANLKVVAVLSVRLKLKPRYGGRV